MSGRRCMARFEKRTCSYPSCLQSWRHLTRTSVVCSWIHHWLAVHWQVSDRQYRWNGKNQVLRHTATSTSILRKSSNLSKPSQSALWSKPAPTTRGGQPMSQCDHNRYPHWRHLAHIIHKWCSPKHHSGSHPSPALGKGATSTPPEAWDSHTAPSALDWLASHSNVPPMHAI